MKLVSWNVNSIKARLDRVLRLIEMQAPDVLCLQELKCEEEAFPKQLFASLGYESAVFGQKQYNGVAILSKLPLSQINKGLSNYSDSRLVGVTLANRWRIYCAYVPNGQEVDSPPFLYKLDWLGSLRAQMSEALNLWPELAIVGDFNITPQDLDSWDPLARRGSIFHTSRERDKLKDLLALGLWDSLRLFDPGPTFSWWDYRAGSFQKNHGLRIDLALVSTALKDRCLSAGVWREERQENLPGLGEGCSKPSDHAPVWFSLDL